MAAMATASVGTMRCLWLTLADPDPPHNGQYVYTSGLIHSLAEAGAAVTVLGHQRIGSDRRDGETEGNIEWRLADPHQLSRWSSAMSSLPNLAHRCCTADMSRKLDGLLHDRGWDAIVLDGITSGWALGRITSWLRHQARLPKLVYISHNHEGSLRKRLAQEQRAPLKRHAMRADARKVHRLEQALVAHADLVTAITPEDAGLYRREWKDKPIEVLLPGFVSAADHDRPVTEDSPRRAVLVGSFDWIAKRMNLEDFVRIADPLFAAHGVELHIVGSGEAGYLDEMRGKVVTTRFIGPVKSVREYVQDARVAVVPEYNGGGFKLKVLDYVFGQRPILALDGSVAGMPLTDPDSIKLYPDQEALARGVIDSIDDLDQLNRQRRMAWSACHQKFDWRSRGQQLAAAIEGL